MASSYENRWEVVRELGEGGQGQVWLVRGRQLYTNVPFLESFVQALGKLGPFAVPPKAREEAFAKLRQGILDMVKSESPSYQGALKVLHKPEWQETLYEPASEYSERYVPYLKRRIPTFFASLIPTLKTNGSSRSSMLTASFTTSSTCSRGTSLPR